MTLKNLPILVITTFMLLSICTSFGSQVFSLGNSENTGTLVAVSSNGPDRQMVIGVNGTYYGACTALASLVQQAGGQVVDNVSMGGETVAFVADLPATNYSFLGKEAMQIGLARYVEPRMLFKAQFEPNDPYYNRQWAPPQIQANWAWNLTQGNSSVLVGIVDTGHRL